MVDTEQLLNSILENGISKLDTKEVDDALNELSTRMRHGEKLEPEEYSILIFAFIDKIYSLRLLICEREGVRLMKMLNDPTEDFTEFHNKYCKPLYTSKNNVLSWFIVDFYEDGTQGYELNVDERKIKDELKIVVEYYNEAKKWLIKKGYLV